ncbi:MAG TPA: transglycosylase domain-containing protein [Candidatus Sulfotelmatobacter sp.]|nr:transglycosylase domain-containing protein [Candidatus Sulfotelmatobacter sp.]
MDQIFKLGPEYFRVTVIWEQSGTIGRALAHCSRARKIIHQRQPSPAIILKCDGSAEYPYQDPAADGFPPPILYSGSGLIIGVVLLWSLAALILVAARWIDPLTTAVHIQRRLQAWIHHTPYRERYKFIPLNQISPDLQHTLITAEDAHFYQHHGFDWHAGWLPLSRGISNGLNVIIGQATHDQSPDHIRLGAQMPWRLRRASSPRVALVCGR